MNLRNTIDNLKKPFGKGEKWERFAPAFNALDTFLYVPNHTTKHGSHIRDAVDLKRTMITVIIALIPALLYGITTGFQYYSRQISNTTCWMLFYMVLTNCSHDSHVFVGLAIEFAFAVFEVMKLMKDILLRLLVMIMPIDIPLWMVAFQSLLLSLSERHWWYWNRYSKSINSAGICFAYPTYMSVRFGFQRLQM